MGRQQTRFTKNYIVLIIAITANFIVPTHAAYHPHLQAIHVLDPGIQEFKYHSSWNSDQWIQWVRNRYIEDVESRRFLSGEDVDSPDPPLLYGQWVNIIIIASEEEIHSSFNENSNHSYTASDKGEYLWSDISFPVFVVVRKPNKDGGWGEGQDENEQSPRFNVFNCSNKKMFINAKVDLSSTPSVVLSIRHLFPKKVKNPKDTLRIPLVACIKVGQRRGLLDEIKFQLKN